jgi:hypothetical protein
MGHFGTFAERKNSHRASALLLLFGRWCLVSWRALLGRRRRRLLFLLRSGRVSYLDALKPGWFYARLNRIMANLLRDNHRPAFFDGHLPPYESAVVFRAAMYVAGVLREGEYPAADS